MSDTVLRGLCSNCGKEVELAIVEREEEVKVKGEPINVTVRYSRCGECGDEVLDPNISQDPLELAYSEYRHRHGMLQPEEIRKWRESWGLSQHQLAELLGLGTATLNRYENGALQSESHEKLLRFAMGTANLVKLVEESKDVLGTFKKESLLQRLKGPFTECGSNNGEDFIVIRLGRGAPDEFSGYVKFSVRKLLNAILYFSEGGVWKTKLNKLLFYADFKHFQHYTVSITGASYVHVPFGPAPDNFSGYFAAMASQGTIEFIEEDIGEKIKSIDEPDLTLFSTTELEVMRSVKEHFEGWYAGEVSDLSHKELGYVQTKNGEKISYRYANDLKY